MLCRIVAAEITGIASINENFKASTLDKPKNRAIVMVIPDREVPGINANI